MAEFFIAKYYPSIVPHEYGGDVILCQWGCNSSDGRAAASYPADPGSNLAVSGSNEIALSSKFSIQIKNLKCYSNCVFT